jgi:hypothetical protein
MSKTDPVTYVSYRHDGKQKSAKGRCGWCLAELIAAGTHGITTKDYPGARVSEYIRRLRNDGLDIETKRVSHGGPFPGNYGVLILQSQISVIEIKTASMETGATQ